MESTNLEGNPTAIGARRFKWTLSTGAVDRDGDTVNVHGVRLDRFKRNPVILWGHDASAPPIAKAENVRVENGSLVAEIVFPPRGTYPLSDTVCGLVEAGIVRGASIGFNPVEFDRNTSRGGVDFREVELLEASLVPIPSNAEALRIFESPAFTKAYRAQRRVKSADILRSIEKSIAETLEPNAVTITSDPVAADIAATARAISEVLSALLRERGVRVRDEAPADKPNPWSGRGVIRVREE